MHCRVRYITRLPNGSINQKDQEITVDGNRVRIGRGTNNDVLLKSLSLSYRHADIVVHDNEIVIEALGGSFLRIDGVAVSRGTLGMETVAGIGPYRLTLLPPEPGIDLGIAVVVPSEEEEEEKQGKTAIAPLRIQGGIAGKRPLSWILFLLVLIGGLALPILAHISYRGEPAASLEATAPTQRPQTILAGFDQVWDTGELSTPHRFLEKRCEACHVNAFEPIQNETCGACHGSVRHHFDVAKFTPASFRAQGFEAERCTACHSEHQGPTGILPAPQATCTGCHEDLKGLAPETSLVNVTDFASHPQFRPSIVVDANTQKVERLELGQSPPIREGSGLVFNHLCHLGLKVTPPAAGASEKDRRCYTPDGTLLAKAYPPVDQFATASLQQASAGGGQNGAHVKYRGIEEIEFVEAGGQLRAKLSCGSCHVPATGGSIMAPVDMEQHCAYCHSIEFKDGEMTRVLPHGQPDEVAAILANYYEALAARTPAVRTDATGDRRRPGAGEARRARATPVGSPEFQQRLEQQLAAVFRNDGSSTCGYCHVTTSQQEEGQMAYGIAPVQVQRVWMPKAHFDHRSHMNVACTDCHNAEESSVSADVLMPGVASCHRCHAGEEAVAAVPSPCTMCHVYHQEKTTCPITSELPLGDPLHDICRQANAQLTRIVD